MNDKQTGTTLLDRTLWHNPRRTGSTFGILHDKEIVRLCKEHDMINPYEPNQVREVDGQKVISYGTSSYGYDLRAAGEFKIFTNVNTTLIDPKNFDEKNFVTVQGDHCIIPPHGFMLTRSVEYFKIPLDVTTIVVGKSTIARSALDTLVTPLEPGWEGHVTLEFANSSPCPVKFYANEGCAQVLFFRGEHPCEVSYVDRGGKYQGQVGVVTPRL